MKSKQPHSEADGLFMKANRKYQILLNFELKRIAVEKTMRERYFAFEKSLIIAHREKIISKQKSLGIYRPQTTPDKKRPESFFITAVAMETKARMKLPPVVQRKGGTGDGGTRKVRKGRAERTSESFTVVRQERHKGQESFPVLKQNFAVVQARKDSSSLRTSTKNLDLTSSDLDEKRCDLRPFVRHDESGKADRQTTREGEGGKFPDGKVEKVIENKRTGKDFMYADDGVRQVENIGTGSDPQTGDNAEKLEVKQDDVANKTRRQGKEEHLKQYLESKSNVPKKNAARGAEVAEKGREVAGKNIPDNEEENSSDNNILKQSDEGSLHETLRRSKSVLSGVMDESRSKVIDVSLRAQSAGVQGRGTKLAPLK